MIKSLSALKIGILGGGQLGRMLVQAAGNLPFDIELLEESIDFPAPQIWPNFKKGSFKSYDDVVAFGKDKDIISIEIEAVNLEALYELERLGVKVYPQPHNLAIIKDKGLQKQYYKDAGFPTSDFKLYKNAQAIKQAILDNEIKIPFVQKARTDGYDGKGVQVIRHIKDLVELFDVPSVIEDLVDINKELAVIVSRNQKGEIKSFPVVEMVFHPTANLVEYLICPSKADKEHQERSIRIAEAIATKMQIVGLLAVELFLDTSGEILINEVAPRAHNSGHHTIEANITSQFEQHLRSICNLPLGNTALIKPAAMANLLGDSEHTGVAVYDGLEDCLEIPDSYIHLYGKQITKPFRKMGHVTAIAEDTDQAIAKAKWVKEKLIIRS